MMFLQISFTVAAFVIAVNAQLHKKNQTTTSTVEKIVAGYRVYIDDYPYQVSVRSGSSFCGGSIISSSHIVTAAHCVKKYSPDQITVRSGSSYSYKGGVISRVSRVICHEKFDSFAAVDNIHDIAILVLEKPLQFDSYTQKIQLASRSPGRGEDVEVSGWGKASFYARRISPTLRATKVRVASDGYGCTPGARVICTKSALGSHTCSGDSGSPLVFDGELVGIVSASAQTDGCTKPHVIRYATSVPYFREWIMREIGDHKDISDSEPEEYEDYEE